MPNVNKKVKTNKHEILFYFSTISSLKAVPINCGTPASIPFVINHTSDAFAA
jgi:hypothetical protein